MATAAANEVYGVFLDKCFENVGHVHGVDGFKPLQKLCLGTLVKGQDVLACLPTGYGKSLIYQTWPTMSDMLARGGYRGVENGIVVVISPLISIMEDQTRLLTSNGIRAAYVGKDERTDQAIVDGEYSVVFGSPESLVSKPSWRAVLQSRLYRQRLVGIAVDEVHTVVDWGLSEGTEAPFRKWYGQVGELRSIISGSVPMLAVTATASAMTRDMIKRELGMQECLEVVKSPDRTNIRLAVKQVSKDPCETFAWLCQELQSKGPNTEKVVIYCKSINDCGLLYWDVFKLLLGEKSVFPVGSVDIPQNRLVDMFHSETSEKIQQQILNSMTDPLSVLRVVIATSALGMGVDFKGVNYIVNYGPPKELEPYMQAFGRAGRDGSDAHSIILYHGSQMIGLNENMREYVTHESSCRRVKLLALYDGIEVDTVTPKHACCNVCALSCDCEQQCNGGSSSLERHAGKGTNQKCRVVSEEQRALLRAELEVRSECLIQEGLYSGVAFYCKSDDVVDAPRGIIEEVLESCSTLFTLEDILCQIQVSDTSQAQLILDVIEVVFPNEESDSEDEDNMFVTALQALEDVELSDSDWIGM